MIFGLGPHMKLCVPTQLGIQRVHLKVLEQNEYIVVSPTATTFLMQCRLQKWIHVLYNHNNDNNNNTLCIINCLMCAQQRVCYVAADMLLAAYDARGVVKGLSGRLCPWLLSWSLMLVFFGFSPVMESLFNTSSR